MQKWILSLKLEVTVSLIVSDKILGTWTLLLTSLILESYTSCILSLNLKSLALNSSSVFCKLSLYFSSLFFQWLWNNRIFFFKLTYFTWDSSNSYFCLRTSWIFALSSDLFFSRSSWNLWIAVLLDPINDSRIILLSFCSFSASIKLSFCNSRSFCSSKVWKSAFSLILSFS